MNGGLSNGPGAAAPPKNPLQPLQRKLQIYLDKSTPHVLYRWMVLVVLVAIYGVRVLYIKGFYIVTYALAIYNLNLLLGFLTPQIDPEAEAPVLPSKQDEEFRPFVRRLPEFKFWLHSARAFLLGFGATFFAVFDVPVFWPILVLYWLVLFFVTMKRQIMHMIKYRYLPFSLGKKRYGKGGSGSAAKLSK